MSKEEKESEDENEKRRERARSQESVKWRCISHDAFTVLLSFFLSLWCS
jgi:hypothetical protein